jgi:hypothetical protein
MNTTNPMNPINKIRVLSFELIQYLKFKTQNFEEGNVLHTKEEVFQEKRENHFHFLKKPKIYLMRNHQ